MSREEADFRLKIEELNQTKNEKDFGIPENIMNEGNHVLYNRAVKELQKLERYPTPGLKLKYLLNSFMIVNNCFSLFTSVKDNMAASADDMLLIYPYIVLQAKISSLFQHIKFIRMLGYKELLVGERAYVFSKLEISTKILKDM